MGGGSTIDVAKWLARKFKIRHTAIPTTTGTGSEVTKYCVLMVDGKKKTYDLDVPETYVLDPRLTVTLPKVHTISSGLDALSQALESLWSQNATERSRMYSSLALDLVLENLPKSLKMPKNTHYRGNMLLAAHLAGRAIQITRTNVCHAVSYPLTEMYNIPHGIACGMSLGYFTKKAIGLDIKDFIKSLLPNYKINPFKIAEIVIKNPKLKDFPFPITKEDIYKSLL